MNLFNVGDQLALNFVHKRLLGAAKSFVESGFNPIAAAGGFFRPPTAPPVRRPAPRTLTARPSATSAAEKEMGRQAKLGTVAVSRSFDPTGAGPCRFPAIKVAGKCVDLTAIPIGGRPFVSDPSGGGGFDPGTPVGDAVMGRYGAGLTPGSRIIDRAVCLRGMQLGNDGLCYNKGQIKNSERMWPRGRRPLLTGGDMRAISVASRAANRLTRTAVRLQEIGLIKKPVTRKPRKKSAH